MRLRGRCSRLDAALPHAMKLALIRQRYTPFGGAERFMDRAITALGSSAEVTVLARDRKSVV